MGVRVIRAFDRGSYEQERFNEANLDLTTTALRVNRMMVTLAPPLNGLLINFTTIAIIWFGAKRIDLGVMQVGGDMMAFLQYAMQILWAIMMLSILFVMLPRASASAERLVEVFETKPTIQDPDEPRTVESFTGVVEFDNVTFSYPGAEAPVLSGITFRAEPGKTTAIIGGTGSGKSTILDLVPPRFYDPQQGKITLDGIDLRDLPQRELRQVLGYVPQQAVLFSGTVAENIRGGKQDATAGEVTEAARIAQAEQFVLDRDGGGFQSYIAQGGAQMSRAARNRDCP